MKIKMALQNVKYIPAENPDLQKIGKKKKNKDRAGISKALITQIGRF